MGNAESNEAGYDGESWDNSAPTSRTAPAPAPAPAPSPPHEPSFWEDFMGFSTTMWPEAYHYAADDVGSVGGRKSSASTAPGSPAPASLAAAAAVKEGKVVDSAHPTPSEPTPPSKDAESAQQEIADSNGTATTTTKEVAAEAPDLHISKAQITSPSHTKTGLANGGSVTSRVWPMMRGRPMPPRSISLVLFLLVHGILIAIIIYLSVLYGKDMTDSKIHNLQRWYPQLCLAVVIGGLVGLIFQTALRRWPKYMVHSIVWISALVTLGASILLIAASVPASLAVGAMSLIFSICQALYAFWISSRTQYAALLFDFCLIKTAGDIQGIYMSSVRMVLAASIWLFVWNFGIVCAVSTRSAPFIILAFLVIFAFTLQTFRNVVCAATARRAAAFYLEQEVLTERQSLQSAFTRWFGNILLGSLFVPTVHFLHVMARGLQRIHGRNEFMFSCADCFYGVTGRLYRHANNWAFVQVTVWSKGFFTASSDTITLFQREHIDRVIEKDLTSSFCVLSGISGGMLCAISSGSWTFTYHKDSVTSVSLIAFCIGYFLVRIMMAVPHGIICAHYVCYAENPMGRQMAGSLIAERLKELSKSDPEAGHRS